MSKLEMQFRAFSRLNFAIDFFLALVSIRLSTRSGHSLVPTNASSAMPPSTPPSLSLGVERQDGLTIPSDTGCCI
ncbi:hypothetical protein ANO11243_015570 [Dothideomycetidae sp. 11243]|nr:hypothetical protein ANO11243_015570 [fungal sp. No.11243]